MPRHITGALAAAAAAATFVVGCGSGDGGSPAAKAGDCIDSGKQVVDCGSGSAAQKLVSDQSKPNAIACVQIGAAPQTEVKVAGGTFCAAPIQAGGSPGGAAAGGSASTKSVFKSRYEQVTAQMQATAGAAATELESAKDQTAREIAQRFIALSGDWAREIGQLTPLQPPKAVLAEFNALRSAAGNAEGSMHAMISAAATGNTAAAKRAARALLMDLVATKNAAKLVENGL